MAIGAKYEKLLGIISPYERAVVAFSGGVDSSLLAYAAAEALGRENVLCVTARGMLFPAREFEDAKTFCADHGIRQEFVDFGIDMLADNPPDRCYLCKLALFKKFIAAAACEGIETVIEGSNLNDLDDYRPGMRAVRELGIKSPLLEACLTKDDVRAILKELGLPAWDKAPLACLATRIPYGEKITDEKLAMIDRAEQFLFEKGFKQVRVRIHGEIDYTAVIEVMPDEIKRLGEFCNSLGFAHVSIDPSGYRTGSMNEGL